MTIIYSERLLIRDYLESDFENFYNLTQDKEVVCWMPDAYPESKDETLELFFDALMESKKEKRKKFYYAITDQSTGAYIGEVGFRVIHHTEEGAVVNIGYFIDQRYWGQGVATEAVKAVVAYGFDKFDILKFELSCSAQNIGSIKVAERNNFVKEASKVKSLLLNGTLHDQYDFRLLKEEFMAL